MTARGRSTPGSQPQEDIEPVADDWRTPETEALVDAIVRLDERDDAARFLRDLCTLGELHDLAQRWAVARLLDSGMHYAEISRRSGASTATITRIASWLKHGEDGYRRMLERLRAQDGTGPGDGMAPADGATLAPTDGVR
jgi:TrpR-related protein YerC/YecD